MKREAVRIILRIVFVSIFWLNGIGLWISGIIKEKSVITGVGTAMCILASFVISRWFFQLDKKEDRNEKRNR